MNKKEKELLKKLEKCFEEQTYKRNIKRFKEEGYEWGRYNGDRALIYKSTYKYLEERTVHCYPKEELYKDNPKYITIEHDEERTPTNWTYILFSGWIFVLITIVTMLCIQKLLGII